jgi:hypothetical protein
MKFERIMDLCNLCANCGPERQKGSRVCRGCLFFEAYQSEAPETEKRQKFIDQAASEAAGPSRQSPWSFA